MCKVVAVIRHVRMVKAKFQPPQALTTRGVLGERQTKFTYDFNSAVRAQKRLSTVEERVPRSRGACRLYRVRELLLDLKHWWALLGLDAKGACNLTNGERKHRRGSPVR